MRKFSLTIGVFILCIYCAFGQNDSLAFVSGNWTESKVADDVVLKQCHFANGELFNGSNQFVSVMEIGSARTLHIVAAPEKTLQLTSAMAQATGALVALNGSFFNMRAPYGGTTYTRICGVQVADNSTDGDPVRSYRQNGAVAVRNGVTFILKADRMKEWEKKYISADDVITSGPIMMSGGVDAEVPQKAFNTNRHPRTAVGKKADGTVVFVVVDGRTNQSFGVSIFELREIMKWIGCVDALNLDGGGSSTMTVGSKVVNMPCDNKKFDTAGERSVANALIVL